MNNPLLESFPHYREGVQNSVKVTYEFYGGEQHTFFTSKSDGEQQMSSLKETNTSTTIWEHLNQNYDMGEKWKLVRNIFKWVNGSEKWDFNEKFIGE